MSPLWSDMALARAALADAVARGFIDDDKHPVRHVREAGKRAAHKQVVRWPLRRGLTSLAL
jgi:hypothetical protein